MKFEIGTIYEAKDKDLYLKNITIIEVLANVICVQQEYYAGLKWFTKEFIVEKFKQKT